MTLPQPLYFASDTSVLFGWLHQCDDPTPGLGLVLCSPFGREDIVAHRSLRAFAEAAANVGVPALRFDYDGCGDSSGDDLDPARIQAWTRSINDAVEELKRASGVRRVVLLGVRLGALLAFEAANGRTDVAGLIAIAPVLSGRLFLRELAVLGASDGTATGMGTEASSMLEAGGFTLTGATREALGVLDIRTPAAVPAREVLVIERDDMPPLDKWRAALERVGSEVTVARCPGYVAMVDESHHAKVPHAMVDAAVQWLRPRAAALAGQGVGPGDVQATTVLRVTTDEGHVALRESAFYLDNGETPLFGVLTQPGDTAAVPRAALMMLNGGAVRRIGPNRMYVRLAREWGARGFAVLRLDIAGLGDSPARGGHHEDVVYPHGALADVAAALHHLRDRLGIARVHVIGLCSGGYHGLKAAVHGHNLASVVSINPEIFFVKEETTTDPSLADHIVVRRAAYYRQSMLSVRRWIKVLRGQVNVKQFARIFARKLSLTASAHGRELARALRLPLKDDLAGELRRVAGRGIPMHFVLSGEDSGLALLRAQGGRVFRRLHKRGQLTLHMIDGADHTLTKQSAREQLSAALRAMLAGDGSAASPQSEPASLPSDRQVAMPSQRSS